MAESFFSTLEAELLKRRRFTSQAEAKMACFSYIEGWYNPVRLHSALAYRSPITYEAHKEAALGRKPANRPPNRVNPIARHSPVLSGVGASGKPGAVHNPR